MGSGALTAAKETVESVEEKVEPVEESVEKGLSKAEHELEKWVTKETNHLYKGLQQWESTLANSSTVAAFKIIGKHLLNSGIGDAFTMKVSAEFLQQKISLEQKLSDLIDIKEDDEAETPVSSSIVDLVYNDLEKLRTEMVASIKQSLSSGLKAVEKVSLSEIKGLQQQLATIGSQAQAASSKYNVFLKDAKSFQSAVSSLVSLTSDLEGKITIVLKDLEDMNAGNTIIMINFASHMTNVVSTTKQMYVGLEDVADAAKVSAKSSAAFSDALATLIQSLTSEASDVVEQLTSSKKIVDDIAHAGYQASIGVNSPKEFVSKLEKMLGPVMQTASQIAMDELISRLQGNSQETSEQTTQKNIFSKALAAAIDDWFHVLQLKWTYLAKHLIPATVTETTGFSFEAIGLSLQFTVIIDMKKVIDSLKKFAIEELEDLQKWLGDHGSAPAPAAATPAAPAAEKKD